MFSHPSFVRGQPHLLSNIARKSNPKKKGKDGQDEEGDYHVESSSADHKAISLLESRLALMEKKVERISTLEQEMKALKQELVQFKELAAAQNLLSLAPEISKKRVKEDPLKEKEEYLAKSEKDDPIMSLQPPKKITRLTSVDSVFEMKDFPFEDTSSLGSVSVRDLMRELQ